MTEYKPIDPLVPAELNLPSKKTYVRQLMNDFGTTKKKAVEMYRMMKQDKVYLNSKYQVNVHDRSPIVHISIKRIDKGPAKDWRDFQDIKNQILGPECEAVELYPAESRLIDGANQFHLWGIPDTGFKFPFGFHEGRQVSSDSVGGCVQRPREDECNSN